MRGSAEHVLQGQHLKRVIQRGMRAKALRSWASRGASLKLKLSAACAGDQTVPDTYAQLRCRFPVVPDTQRAAVSKLIWREPPWKSANKVAGYWEGLADISSPERQTGRLSLNSHATRLTLFNHVMRGFDVDLLATFACVVLCGSCKLVLAVSLHVA